MWCLSTCLHLKLTKGSNFFRKFDSGQKGQAIRVTEAMKVMGAMRVTEAMMFMEALGVMEANKVTEAVRARKVLRVCVVWPKRARPCGSLRPRGSWRP